MPDRLPRSWARASLLRFFVEGTLVTILLTLIHVLVAVFLILVVLLQTGKRADLAGAFGGGGSQTAFGARGAATLLSKATTWSAVIFMATSLALSLLGSGTGGDGGSVLDSVPAATTGAPASPVPQPATPPVPPSSPAPSN
jgi:preprotein translocase subunit SecG